MLKHDVYLNTFKGYIEYILCFFFCVCADMGQFDATKGKQALEIRSSLSERRALTDLILPGDSTDLAHAHSRQWAKAHGKCDGREEKRYLLIICHQHVSLSETVMILMFIKQRSLIYKEQKYKSF